MPRKKTAVEAEVLPSTAPTPEMTSPSDALPPSDVNGAAPEPAPPQSNGNGDKRQPVFKVGPIPTDKNNAVSAAVWANEYTDPKDGRTFTVYNVTVEARWRDALGEWKSGKSFRGSQLYALLYCLQRASDWICEQRDPASTVPF